MSLLKKTLIATTALTLSSTVVWADGNEAILEQTDNGGAARINTALINQADGNNNTIDGLQTGVGAHEVAVLQVGNNNTANFSQVGSGNIAGISQ